MLLLNKLKKITILFFLFFSFQLSSQTEVDIIKKKSYSDIYKLIKSDSILEKKLFYAHIFLKKAKEEKVDSNLVKGYHILSFLNKDEKKLQYADTIIAMTASNSNDYYPAIAYQIKGDFFYFKRAYKKALDNYLLVSFFANKHNDKELIFRSNLNIGNIKRQTGNFDEALDLFRKNFYYVNHDRKNVPDWNYLMSISSLASIFNEKKNIDSATFYNKLGILEASKLKNEFQYAHFAVNQGVTHYHEKRYKIAIDSIEKHIPYFEKNKSQTVYHEEELSFIYYYSGESYFKINNTKKGVEYFKKVDTIFENSKFLFPTLKDTYRRLIDYYEEKNDLKNQLIYINQFIKVDSILDSDDLYLNREVIRGYNIPKLKAEKERVLKELESQKKISSYTFYISSIFIVFLIIGFVFQYQKRKLYRKRFKEIMYKVENVSSEISKKENHVEISKKIDIPNNLIEEILEKLKKFERNEGFRSSTITLNSLARKLKTNPNYLSKVVNYHKKTSFSNYLNNLRIEYAVHQLKTNSTYGKYTIKAISSEVGFNNTQSFVRAFYKSKGINPSYFIKELKRINHQ